MRTCMSMHRTQGTYPHKQGKKKPAFGKGGLRVWLKESLFTYNRCMTRARNKTMCEISLPWPSHDGGYVNIWDSPSNCPIV
jgi:hypothetical protein